MESSVTAASSIEIIKKCSRCDFEGPLDDFPKDKAFSTGRRPECKKCYNDYRKKLFDAKSPEWKKNKNKKTIARHKKRYHSDPEFKMYINRATQETMNKRKYGLDSEDIVIMLNEQDLRCKMCGKDISERHNIDHCHETNRVRGILCGSCNRGIGLLQDSPKILMDGIIHMCVGRIS